MKCWPSPILAFCLVGLAAFSLAAAGCQSTTPSAGAQAYPADFALQFFVQASTLGQDPMARQAQHILEPDRRLRVALGAGVTPQTFPPATRVLRADQMAELYRRVAAAGLARPDSPVSDVSDSSDITYLIRVTANGRVIDRRRSPNDAGAAEVLKLLVQYRGGR